MTSTEMILLIEEVAALCRVAVSTIRRWLGERRKGRGNFPLPISPPGYKCRWLSSDIARWLESQRVPPIVSTPVTSARQRRKKATAFQQRQEAVKQGLLRHRKPTK